MDGPKFEALLNTVPAGAMDIVAQSLERANAERAPRLGPGLIGEAAPPLGTSLREPLSDGEVHFLWDFIQGGIMDPSTRRALRRSWGGSFAGPTRRETALRSSGRQDGAADGAVGSGSSARFQVELKVLKTPAC